MTATTGIKQAVCRVTALSSRPQIVRALLIRDLYRRVHLSIYRPARMLATTTLAVPGPVEVSRAKVSLGNINANLSGEQFALMLACAILTTRPLVKVNVILHGRRFVWLVSPVHRHE